MVQKQIQQIRAEVEGSPGEWLLLPDADDKEVDWTDFIVELEAPVLACLLGARGTDVRELF